MEIRPRDVEIKELAVTDIDMDEHTVTFDVTCSKGTYIRTICSDLGDALGCGGAMQSLSRTESGAFTLENAVTPYELKNMTPEDIEERLLDIDLPLSHLGKAEMAPDRTKYFCNGNSIRWKQVRVLRKPAEYEHEKYNSRGRKYSELYGVYESGTGNFLGVGYYSRKENAMKADKIFADI